MAVALCKSNFRVIPLSQAEYAAKPAEDLGEFPHSQYASTVVRRLIRIRMIVACQGNLARMVTETRGFRNPNTTTGLESMRNKTRREVWRCRAEEPISRMIDAAVKITS
jgi:hypothetical protein